MCRNKFHEYFLLNIKIESQLILIVVIDSPKSSELFGTLIKFELSEKHIKFEKKNLHDFDKSADLLSKRQKHEEDFFSNYVCFSKSPNLKMKET